MSTPTEKKSRAMKKKSSTQTGRSVGSHTYTPQSHENLLIAFSKTKIPHSDLKVLKRKNEELQNKLKRVNELLRTKHEKIQSLERELADIKLNFSFQQNYQHNVKERNISEAGIYACDVLDSSEILNRHFNEVIRRYHEALEDKNNQIKELQEALKRCKTKSQEEIWTHDFHTQSSMEKERLRRNETSVKMFNNEFTPMKIQLKDFFPSKSKYTSSKGRDIIDQELEKRTRFGIIADIEQMGQNLLQRLALEEKMDKLHSKIETKRYQALQDKFVDEFELKYTLNQEFEMLSIARHNLLEALNQLRNKITNDGIKHRVQFKDSVSVTTIQTLYSPSVLLINTSESDTEKSPQEGP